jgi:peroxiredoxin
MAAIAPAAALGWTAPGFRLLGTDGTWHTLAQLAGPGGTLIAFICNHCPYVKAILPRLRRDADRLAPLGVKVIAVNANDADAYPEDSYPRMVELAQEWPFPYLHDPTQEVARAYGAVCTPDFFGFDASRQLRYRGRLDASLKLAGDIDAVPELYLAMSLIAATGQGPEQQYPSIGCSIKWRD